MTRPTTGVVSRKNSVVKHMAVQPAVMLLLWLTVSCTDLELLA